MRIAITTEFRISKKDPLAEAIQRISDGFAAAGLGEAKLQFVFSDSSQESRASAVSRALKKLPALAAFATEYSELPDLLPPVPALANLPGTPGEALDFPAEAFAELIAGIPKSFPFAGTTLSFSTPAFGEGAITGFGMDLRPGVHIEEASDVFGRRRSLSSIVVMESGKPGKKAPPLPQPIAALHEILGKAKKSSWMPVADAGAAEPAPPPLPAIPAATLAAIETVRQTYGHDWPGMIERADLPFDLPPLSEVPPFGQPSGPKKPALMAHFGPLGYECESGSGTYTLTRLTPGNLKVEVYIDVGTWSHQLTATYKIEGAGFAATLPLPACRQAAGVWTYPIGPDTWPKMVANIAALTALLDRTMAAEIEALSGPIPAWIHGAA